MKDLKAEKNIILNFTQFMIHVNKHCERIIADSNEQFSEKSTKRLLNLLSSFILRHPTDIVMKKVTYSVCHRLTFSSLIWMQITPFIRKVLGQTYG